MRIDSYTLPDNFQYQFRFKKRLSVEETIDSVIIQTQPFIDQDVDIEFNITRAEESIRNIFLDKYKTGSFFTLYLDEPGYDNKTAFKCLISSYEETERYAKYDLKGTMEVLG